MQSVVPVKTAITGLLQAAAWPTSSPTIRWAGPTESEDYSRSPELIYFSEVQQLEESHTILGTGPIPDENYNLRITLDVVASGDREQETETRAWALYEVLRRALVNNRNPVEIAGEVSVRLGDRTVTQTNVAIPKAWVVRIQVDQAISARVFNP